MSVSLSSKLPAGDGNGLEVVVYALKDPGAVIPCVCLVSGKYEKNDFESGETVTTARIRRIEAILDDEDRKIVENVMRRALDRRTGREALPYDLEEEIRGAFPANAEDLPSEDTDQ